MSETPNEPRRRASLRGKGWQILRGTEPPDDLPLPTDEPAVPEFDEAVAVDDDAVLDWVAAPELSKLKASPPIFEEPDTAYDLADFEDLEVGTVLAAGLMPVESVVTESAGDAPPEPVLAAESRPETSADPAEVEAVPRIEQLLGGQAPVALTYAARPEVDSLVPATPEALGEFDAQASPVSETGSQAQPSVTSLVPSQATLVTPDDAIIRPQDVRIDAGRLAPISGRRPAAREWFGEARTVEPDESLLDRFVTDERLQKLWEDIDTLQEQIVHKVQSSRELTDAYQTKLLEASALLLQDRANYDDVRAIIYRVRADLAHEEKVRQDTEKFKPLILRFLRWSFVLWVLLMTVEPLFHQFMNNIGLGALGMIYHPTMFGMLGAIVYAYFTLNRHAIQLRDFDPAYVSWYMMNPYIGIIMGLLMTLVFTTAIISTLGAGMLDQAGSALLGQYPFLLWVLCFLAGYNQNVLLRLLYRTFGLLRGQNNGDESRTSAD